MIFSVIIPVYNVEQYLEECIDSVLAQDFKDYEIILVNDGSTDNSGKICDDYSTKFHHIKTIHKENGGLSDARNFGIKQAKGDYIMFLDSDDYWGGVNGNKIFSDLYLIINKKNPDVIIHGNVDFDDNGYYYESHKKDLGLSEDFILHYETLVRNIIYEPTGCNKIVRRALIIENNINFMKGVLHEDAAWCFDIAQYIKTYVIYESIFYQYRKKREGAITNTIKDKNVISLIEICSEKTKYLLSNRHNQYFKGNLMYLTIVHMAVYRNYFNKMSIKYRRSVNKHFYKLRQIENIYKPVFIDYVKGIKLKLLINLFGINRGLRLMDLYANYFHEGNSFKF